MRLHVICILIILCVVKTTVQVTTPATEGATSVTTSGTIITESTTAGNVTTPATEGATSVTTSGTIITESTTAGNGTTADSNGTTVETTLTTATPTAIPTIRPHLNLSPNLSPFWVITVLRSVPTSINVAGAVWRNDMEQRLLELLAESRALTSSASGGSGRRRRRRFAASGDLRLQLVSAARASSSERVTLTYYAMLGSDTYLEAAAVVAAISGNAARAAVVLGYSVQTAAAVYDSSATGSGSSRLWVIGVAFGSLAAISLIVWAVLFSYHKCLKPYEAPKYTRAVDEYFDPDSAMAKKPSGYSSAEIDQLADQVAKRLDGHMTQMLHESSRRRRRREPGQESLAESDDEYEEIRATGGGHGNAAFAGSDAVDGGVEEEVPVEETVDAPQKQAAVYAELQRGGPESQPASRSAKRHEEAERRRNKDRLRKKGAVDGADAKPALEEAAMALEEIDRSQAEILELEPAAGQRNATSDFNLDADFIIPVPDALDATAALPAPSRQPLSFRKSPYAVGDRVAKIMPYLETDLEKHYNLTQPDEQVAAERHHRQLVLEQQARASGAEGAARRESSPRLIAVEPASPGLNLERPTLAGESPPAGGQQQQGGFPGTNLVVVRPASANQDEWDVIRDCVRQPGSDPQVLLTVLKREVEQLRAAGAPNTTHV